RAPRDARSGHSRQTRRTLWCERKMRERATEAGARRRESRKRDGVAEAPTRRALVTAERSVGRDARLEQPRPPPADERPCRVPTPGEAARSDDGANRCPRRRGAQCSAPDLSAPAVISSCERGAAAPQ